MKGRTAFAALAAVLICASCGFPASGAGSEPLPAKGEIYIGFEGPLSGAESSLARPLLQAARLAVAGHPSIRGFKLSLAQEDDALNGKHNSELALENLQTMIADSRILGVVGPYNSTIAWAMMPLANRTPLALISPSNTDECLTRSLAYCPQPVTAGLRPTGLNNYFRTAAADPDQGIAMAQFANGSLKVTKLAVITSGRNFGVLADSFSREFVARGGAVVARQDFDFTTTTDFRPFLVAARLAGAEAIYAAGTSRTKACLIRAQMAGIFVPDAYFLGSDGLMDQDCIKDAGPGAGAMVYATAATDDPTRSGDSAVKKVVGLYRAHYPGHDDLQPYAFAAYDAAEILVAAIERAIDRTSGKMPTRQQVIDALAVTRNYKGLTGTYTFDAGGDATTPVLAVYKISDGTWTYVRPLVLSR